MPKQQHDRLGMWSHSLAGQSLILDLRTLSLPSVAGSRLSFILRKYYAAAVLLSGREATVRVGPHDFALRTVDNLGTLHSSIVDLYTHVVAADLFDRSPVVIDVGANVGQFCFAVKAFYPDAEVVSIEADPGTFEQLRRNLAGVNAVTALNAAVGDQPGSKPWYRHRLSGMSSFVPYDSEEYGPADILEIPLVTLDSLLEGRPAEVDLLKIDVEGFELNVLRGAEDLLRRTRFLLVEVSLARSSGSDASNVDLVRWIGEHASHARLVSTGRPLGLPAAPVCQDFLFDLRGST